MSGMFWAGCGALLVRLLRTDRGVKALGYCVELHPAVVALTHVGLA
ncbi:hypothetical protein WDV93_11420 [Pantoea ananatis]